MRFQVLDIEKEPAQQGFIEAEYDAIVAAIVSYFLNFVSSPVELFSLKPPRFFTLLRI